MINAKLTATAEKLPQTFERCGIDPNGGSNIIVSLTSFPARINFVHTALFSLLNQSMKPEMVILWLTEEEFPEKEKSLPQKILQLQKNGLSIRWTKSIGSFQKLIPALKEFSDKIIVTADDDIFYRPEWLETLYQEYQNAHEDKNNFIYAHRVHQITFGNNGLIKPYSLWKQCINTDLASFINFATGVGGVLYPPHSLHKDIFKEDIFMTLTPKADDIFFWAMAVRKGTKIKCILNSSSRELIDLNIPGLTLYSTNQQKVGGNDAQLKALLAYYPDVLQLIVGEEKYQTRDNSEISFYNHLRDVKASISNIFIIAASKLWKKIKKRLNKRRKKNLDKKRKYFNSSHYWNKRYQTGGNSGMVSYNHLRDFKASVINTFITEENIKSIIDFGVGDGSLLSQLITPCYLGVDVSSYIIEQLKEKFSDHTEKKFITTQEYSGQTAELSMSIDVIYHLIEDEVFHEYMERLFDAATRNVIIYSSNTENLYDEDVHVKHRGFSL